MKIENVAVDRINLRIEKVTSRQWQQIIDGLFYLVRDDKIVNYKVSEKFGVADYRHSINIDVANDRQGAIYLGFKNNSAKLNVNCTYDMKIEFNPSKSTEMTTNVHQLLNGIIGDNTVRLIEFDIAIDVPYKLNDVFSFNARRQYSNVNGTRYYGKMHKDGYLKIYDKAKERKEVANVDIGKDLTRIEFTVKPNDGGGISHLNLLDYTVSYDKVYKIGLLNSIKNTLTKCVVLALLSPDNSIKYKHLSKSEQAQVSSDLKEVKRLIQLDRVINDNMKDLVESFEKWFFNSANKSDNILIFDSEDRDITKTNKLSAKSKADKIRRFGKLEYSEQTYEEQLNDLNNNEYNFKVKKDDKRLEIEELERQMKEISNRIIQLKKERKENFRHKKSLHSLATG